VRAVLSLGGGAGERDASEVDLRDALNIARRQEAPSLELRAARDLASMLAERDERHQALELLAPVYGGFTEGFATADLQEAKSLLEELRT
jgi:predicted ATPase